ncbi:Colicin-E7 immunity protein [compost metagenome]
MNLKPSISDYTEIEFLDFIKYIYFVNENLDDNVLNPLLNHFEAVTEHPAGTDLIYWPETEEQGEPEQVLELIKQWRAANDKPGFKTEK